MVVNKLVLLQSQVRSIETCSPSLHVQQGPLKHRASSLCVSAGEGDHHKVLRVSLRLADEDTGGSAGTSRAFSLLSGTTKGELINRVLWVELSCSEESPGEMQHCCFFLPLQKSLHNEPARPFYTTSWQANTMLF